VLNYTEATLEWQCFVPDHERFCFAAGSRNDLMHKLNSLKGNNDSVRNSSFKQSGPIHQPSTDFHIRDISYFNQHPEKTSKQLLFKKTCEKKNIHEIH